ncbi:MAG: hypothetical protein WAN03_03135 [Candidatus Sulfotelmatobacter sp.]
MLLHDREMHGVARGQALVREDNLFGSFDNRMFNREDLIDRAAKSVESALDVMTTIDRRISVRDLLEYLGIRD